MLLINGVKDLTFIEQTCQGGSAHRGEIITKEVLAQLLKRAFGTSEEVPDLGQAEVVQLSSQLG